MQIFTCLNKIPFMKSHGTSPREFMQKLRPERYSDSRVVKKALLHRPILEYHIETLTSRNQERDFETFCVKLAQLEVAPNLRVQTGPVGGGDAKADSETYPVSEFILQHYWEGDSNAANERWALAISAKKDWVSKIKKDIENIVNTQRNYQKIFFLSSQFIRDKERAKMEDTLTTQYGIRVVIFDRNWILDKVFGNKREALAVVELKMGGGLLEEVLVGPNDYQRQQEFSELETDIEKMISEEVVNGELVHKLIHQALVAAALEMSNGKVLSYFDRAISFAERINDTDCLFLAYYQKAWCAIFYLNQLEILLPIYQTLEKQAQGANNIFRAENLMNLFNILVSLPASLHTIDHTLLEEKRTYLYEIITKIAVDDSKPSASLLAQSMLIFLDLFRPDNQPKDITSLLDKMYDVVDSCDGLIGFPWDQTVEMVEMFGEVFGEFPEYEHLMSLIFQKTEKRKGEIPSAIAQFKFGRQHHDANRPYKAIQFIGRALPGLYKQESRNDYYWAMGIMSQSFIQIDMNWAARASLINAISPMISELDKTNIIPARMVEMYERLRWQEVILGRVGPALRFHQLYLDMRLATYQGDKEVIQQVHESNMKFGHLLMMLIIKTTPESIDQLQQLPDILLELGLSNTASAVLFMLGGKQYLPKEVIESEEELYELFNRWLEAPDQAGLPEAPLFYTQPRIKMESQILGGGMIIDCENKINPIILAESIMAALESFLPTFIQHHVLAKNNVFKITINQSEENSSEPQVFFNKVVYDHLLVECNEFDHHHLSREKQDHIKGKIREIIIQVFAFNYQVNEDIVSLPDTQEALSRALNFTTSFLMLGNASLKKPCYQVVQLAKDSSKVYPFLPSLIPRIDFSRQYKASEAEKINEKQDAEAVPQSEIVVHHIVNSELWQLASMQGVAFAVQPLPSGQMNLLLIPLFTNAEAGKKIFQQWKAQFKENINSKLKIFIVKGINEKHPAWYSLTFAPDDIKKANNFHSYMYCCGHVSTNNSTERLDKFISEFKREHNCFLVPGYYQPGMNQPEIFHESGFYFTNLAIKEAWQIGLDDPSIVGLRKGLEPYIPPGVDNAPIKEVLKAYLHFKS
ncbi:hypothetical protein [Chitinophaga sp. LS1]|uniref:hypothetical protein n=1 Tax=Chitinophaga sp. LS1 TaxID=3051176 RepID=UPI002AAA7315|nr:hypothetical protein [Chitinophaga sp. LS1]WPV67117.1 hypothetical protein QQL36_00060 [Chitinophaga sp. LS1]